MYKRNAYQMVINVFVTKSLMWMLMFVVETGESKTVETMTGKQKNMNVCTS